MRYRLTDPPFAGRAGKGVVVAVIDSGVHASHPHIGGVASGVNLCDGGDAADYADRIGHGTAVAAAIREKSPGADLLAVRVFDRELVTSAEVLAHAIRWAAEHGAQLINLSLGTSNAAREPLLSEAVRDAKARGATVVSARETDGVRWLPGSLPDVAGVRVDWACERDELVAENGAFRASGYPRPIPGVPPERNLSGVSFAVANVTGFLARAIEAGIAVSALGKTRG